LLPSLGIIIQAVNGYLEERGERHVVAVRANFSVTLGRGQESPVRRADEVLAAQPLQDWQTIAWSEGAKGWWRAKFLALRCWRVDGDGTRHVGWLIGQRPGRGQHGDWKHFWSDFPANTPLAVLVEYAPRRHWVEQYHEEAKTELGWDQYQGRRWDGFHRHAITVMLSYSFWSGWKGGSGSTAKGADGRGPLFPPRPDRRRVPLPEVHRRVSEWLRCAAIGELITLDLIDRYCSRKL